MGLRRGGSGDSSNIFVAFPVGFISVLTCDWVSLGLKECKVDVKYFVGLLDEVLIVIDSERKLFLSGGLVPVEELFISHNITSTKLFAKTNKYTNTFK